MKRALGLVIYKQLIWYDEFIDNKSAKPSFAPVKEKHCNISFLHIQTSLSLSLSHEQLSIKLWQISFLFNSTELYHWETFNILYKHFICYKKYCLIHMHSSYWINL